MKELYNENESQNSITHLFEVLLGKGNLIDHYDWMDCTRYYYYYYYLHIYPGYPHHRSVFQWGPATLNYSILIQY
jgi:hypothetical protein